MSVYATAQSPKHSLTQNDEYNTVKPVYKGHSREHETFGLYEQLSFIYRLKLYALFINGKNKTALYRQWFVI
jgi:hypothetical protein